MTDINNIDIITDHFLQAFQQDFFKLQQMGITLFMYLAGIQLTITALWVAMKSSWPDFFAKMLQTFFTFGVFATLIQMGGVWMPQLLNGFISIGSDAGGITSLTPGSLIGQGFSIGMTLFHGFSTWGFINNPTGVLITVVLFVGIILGYTFIAADLAIVLIKSYCLISMSGLFFAFGANELVRPMAINYFKALIGIGLQLLTLYLLLGVGVSLGDQWSADIHVAAENHLILPFLIIGVGVALFYKVVKNIPPFIAGLSGISGFQSMGDAAIGMAVSAGIQAAGAMTGGVGKAVGGGKVTGQVMKSFSHGFRAADAEGAGSIAGIGKKLWGGTKSATGHSVTGAAKAFSDSMSGKDKNTSFSHKMSSHMAEKNGSVPSGNVKPNGISGGKK